MHVKETRSQDSASAEDMFRLPSRAMGDPSTTKTPLVSDDASLALLALLPSSIHDEKISFLRMDIMFKGLGSDHSECYESVEVDWA